MSDLPESLTVVPNIPWEQQTIDQLKSEMDHWTQKVKDASGFASAYAADGFRKSCEAWLVRRIGEKAHA